MATLDFGPHRTSQDYRFTVTSKDDPAIKALKAQAKAHNEDVRYFSRKNDKVYKHQKLQRVRLMARGSRQTADCGMRFWSYLPHCYEDLITHYDVYLSDDSSGMDMLRREIDTGLKPGELNRLDKLKNQQWRLEMKGHIRKRKRQQER